MYEKEMLKEDMSSSNYKDRRFLVHTDKLAQSKCTQFVPEDSLEIGTRKNLDMNAQTFFVRS